MRHRITLALLLTLTAVSCSRAEHNFYYPEVPWVPPAPPERVLRQQPDFTFRSETQQKQFLLRVYEERGFAEQLVTVVDLKVVDENERLATLDEYDYAMTFFKNEWLNKSHDERLMYHRKLRMREKARNATLLKQDIRMLEQSIRDLEQEKFDQVDARIRAQKTVPTEEGAKDVAFLKKRSEQLAFDLKVLNTQLALLEYKLKLYDLAMSR